ncbi:carotenoid oxygenase family protein [Saccharothrix variisporea]|uniref:Dioxygenase n=1 Tax=Saccharothrix variisporea TaxID=543527 RepID=A0A495X669_9PSEU|nr:carotenoid oxygenase family protein [Saccharothrix variisporea]RKT66998.1 retinal pigment epithelial membrane protein [Saccharothrix variisporea]
MAAPTREAEVGLDVRGELPAALDGAYVQTAARGVCGVRLGGGGARWFRGPRPVGLVPAHPSVARPVFDGNRWHTAMSHPGLGYAEHVVHDPGGTLKSATPFPAKGTPVLAVAGRFVVVFDSGPYYSRAAALVGARDPYVHRDDLPVRIGLTDGGEPCWFEVGTGEVRHAVNAHTELGRVVVDAVWEPGVLRRCTLDLATGAVRTTTLPPLDIGGVDPRVANRRHRFVFGTAGDSLVRYDVALGHRSVRDLPTTPSQPVFVPRGRDEGDGWLVALAGDRLLVLDAEDLAARPVAEVALPFAVPASPRAQWVTALELHTAR